MSTWPPQFMLSWKHLWSEEGSLPCCHIISSLDRYYLLLFCFTNRSWVPAISSHKQFYRILLEGFTAWYWRVTIKWLIYLIKIDFCGILCGCHGCCCLHGFRGVSILAINFPLYIRTSAHSFPSYLHMPSDCLISLQGSLCSI